MTVTIPMISARYPPSKCYYTTNMLYGRTLTLYSGKTISYHRIQDETSLLMSVKVSQASYGTQASKTKAV